MSNVIEFLERMGKDAELRHAGDDALRTVLSDMCVSADQREVVLLRDQARLESLLGAPTNLRCTIEPCHEYDIADQRVNHAS